MNTSNTNIQTWQNLIRELSWNQQNAESSARIALSKAYRLDIDRDVAINAVIKLPTANFLRENRYLLYAVWHQIVRELNGEPIHLLDLEPTLETAA